VYNGVGRDRRVEVELCAAGLLREPADEGKPSRVGSFSGLVAVPLLGTLCSVTVLPPCVLKVTARLTTLAEVSHWACRTVAAVMGVLKLNGAPPVGVRNQLMKM